MPTLTGNALTPKSLVIRYRQPRDQRKLVLPLGVPKRASRTSKHAKQFPHTTGGLAAIKLQEHTSVRAQWVLLAGIAMMATWVLLSGVHLAWNWGHAVYRDLLPSPPTTHVTAFVGHEGTDTPSSFLEVKWDLLTQV